MKKILFAILAFLLVSLVFLKISSNNTRDTNFSGPKKEHLKVSTSAARKDVSVLMELGKKKGIFEKNNLSLTWDSLGSSPSNAMIVGEYDASFAGITKNVLAFAAGENLKLLATPLKELNTVSLSKYPREEADKIKTAASNSGEVMMRVKLALESFGADPEEVEYVNVRGTAARLELFKNGTVDFTQINYEDMLAIENIDQYYTIDSEEYLKNSNLSGSIVSTQKALEGKPAALEAFVISAYEINQYALENPDEVKEIIKRKYEVKENLVDSVYEGIEKSIRSANFIPEVQKIESLFYEMEDVFETKIDRPAGEFVYSNFAEKAVSEK